MLKLYYTKIDQLLVKLCIALLEKGCNGTPSLLRQYSLPNDWYYNLLVSLTKYQRLHNLSIMEDSVYYICSSYFDRTVEDALQQRHRTVARIAKREYIPKQT